MRSAKAQTARQPGHQIQYTPSQVEQMKKSLEALEEADLIEICSSIGVDPNDFTYATPTELAAEIIRHLTNPDGLMELLSQLNQHEERTQTPDTSIPTRSAPVMPPAMPPRLLEDLTAIPGIPRRSKAENSQTTATSIPTQTPPATPHGSSYGQTATSGNLHNPKPKQGCSPEFWAQLQNSSAWNGYSPTELVRDVFSVTQYMNNGKLDLNGDGVDDTLLKALDYQTSTIATGPVPDLLCQAVAAMLNAVNPNVNYPLTKAGILAMVDSALASNDPTKMQDIENTLSRHNQLGCPLK